MAESTTTTREEAVNRIAKIMADASAESEAIRTANAAKESARKDALEEIANGYQALLAIVDLVYMGGGRDNSGYRNDMGIVTCDDMGALLRLVARSIGAPLEKIGFAEPLTYVPTSGEQP